MEYENTKNKFEKFLLRMILFPLVLKYLKMINTALKILKELGYEKVYLLTDKAPFFMKKLVSLMNMK